jgi:hypothetical protein
VLVHEYPVEAPLHPVTVVSGAHVVGMTTVVVPDEQQNKPVPSALQLPDGTALPVQLYPVSPAAQAIVLSVLQLSTVTLAEQPRPANKSEKSPRTTNQEFRMRVRVPVLRLEPIYSDERPIPGDEACSGERPFTLFRSLPVSFDGADPTMPPS